MTYTLLIGNNFISNSPNKIRFYDTLLFSLNKRNDDDLPLISATINDNTDKNLIKIIENQCNYCDNSLRKKIDDKDHILITDNNGEIFFESRILDKNTILLSGTFYIGDQKLVVTQNYIILPSGKWIMHDRIDSNSKDVIITNDGIKISE